MTPKQLLEMFVDFHDLGRDLVELFEDAHPELVRPGDTEAPPEAPEGKVDENVRRDILNGKL